MATAANPLANPAGAGLAPEPTSGDSLTKYIRSIEGLTGQQGQGILGSGLNANAAGAATTNSGIAAMAPALDLLTRLTKGDQGDVTQAAQPEIDQIQQQFDAIRNMISLQPRGGGKTTALAEAPFQKAGDIQRTEGAMRTGAAGQLGGLAQGLAGLGISQSGLGLQAAGLGAGLESTSASTALSKEGQDYSQPSAFTQMLQAVETFI